LSLRVCEVFRGSSLRPLEQLWILRAWAALRLVIE
jgi:hypothetical protein